MKLNNKKGVAMFSIIGFLVLFLIVIYIFLYLPFPAFTKLRMIINYFLVIIFWIILQVGLIYGYYKVGSFFLNGVLTLKSKIEMLGNKIKQYISSTA